MAIINRRHTGYCCCLTVAARRTIFAKYVELSWTDVSEELAILILTEC
jgi:hypothetical protein